MNKLTMVLGAVAALAMAAPAVAQDYVRGSVGEEVSSVAAGRDWGAFRGEVAYDSLTDVGDFRQTGRILSVNGYLEPVTIGPVTPYLTGGIGYGQIRSVGFSEDGVIANAGAGASWALTDNWAVNAEWRTYFTGDVRERIKGGTDNFSTDVVSVGVRYRF